MNNDSVNEKARVDSLLKNGRITQEDHQILVSALAKKHSVLSKIWNYIVNPFQSLSSSTNILIGSVSILLMSFIGAKLGIHFRGALDFQIIEEGKQTYSFGNLLIQNIVDVLSVAVFFFAGALIARCKNLRVVDFIATVAFSRLPYALFALALLILGPIFPSLLPRKTDVHESAGVLALALIAITFLAWQITLIFSALKEASGLKGKHLWLTFIFGLVLAEVASYSINTLILK